jgi:8-oxo-dGTP diphosphatase
MLEKQSFEKLQPGRFDHYLPHLSIDCVIFGYHDGQLRVLLLKWTASDLWSLIGGAVLKEESLDHAATRVLYKRVGLKDIFLRQFYTFGSVERVRQSDYDTTFAKLGFSREESEQLLLRTITVGYYTLVDYQKVDPKPDHRTEDFDWWDVRDLPKMVFDHRYIIEQALVPLRHSFRYEYLGKNLLPEQFTMPELQRLYETILDHPLERSNFQKRMLASGMFERMGKRHNGGAHKSPFMYRFAE